ncbi:lytic transglycosylase domain-containing protein [Vibrio cholerae]|uniref:lytic transglycosylase domain-containing protein n=1 Tax=Vibrio cholerae TaxID=666 RepID=UPI0011D89FD7|nr:lytic transglycosylase domain-containing protein [Vibrio cholerae]TXY52047.1 lytic transglycosylase domain-containing protein [Vibrio cholerae]GIB31891.1 IncI1 plasmid conjugative transfer putative membrane protein PilT [Vibrio cholerae]
MKNIIFLLLLSSFGTNVMAECYEKAGQRFDINPKLLRAICFTESALDSRAINTNNDNGSVDYGLCQINSWWLPKLEQFGITKDTLLNDPCENTLVSAWILAGNFTITSDGWKAVGAYNAGWTDEAESTRQEYIALVKKNLEAMQ